MQQLRVDSENFVLTLDRRKLGRSAKVIDCVRMYASLDTFHLTRDN